MTEREQFEALLVKRWAGDRDGLTRREGGEYFLGPVQFAWEAWQAARAQPAQAVPEMRGNPAIEPAQAVPKVKESHFAKSTEIRGNPAFEPAPPSAYVNAANINASDMPGTVVQKLDAAFRAQQEQAGQKAYEKVCTTPEEVEAALKAIEAEAVPLLSDEEVTAEIRARGQMVNGVKGDGFMQGARWAEQAVRAKIGAAVPMTPKDYAAALDAAVDSDAVDEVDMWAFIEGIKAAEKFHGIVGKEGA